ncbi:MAG: hypothetical protein PHY93_20190 [Bacteriovorax sp.]|nr:hypothetical protein [Bacteriovorax sp.]
MKLNFMAIAGWVYLLILPFGIYKYIKTGNFYSRWGGDPRDNLIGFILLAVLLGSYSISETYKVYLKKNKDEK